MCFLGGERRGRPYFAIVNLEKADEGRKIQASIPPVIDIGENILGWKGQSEAII